jgi:hypothetical protein
MQMAKRVSLSRTNTFYRCPLEIEPLAFLLPVCVRCPNALTKHDRTHTSAFGQPSSSTCCFL